MPEWRTPQELKAWGVARIVATNRRRQHKAILLPEAYSSQAEALEAAALYLDSPPPNDRELHHQLQLRGLYVVPIFMRTFAALPRYPDLELLTENNAGLSLATEAPAQR